MFKRLAKNVLQSVQNSGLFSSLNMQIFDDHANNAVMITEAPYSHFCIGLHQDLKDPFF